MSTPLSWYGVGSGNPHHTTTVCSCLAPSTRVYDGVRTTGTGLVRGTSRKRLTQMSAWYLPRFDIFKFRFTDHLIPCQELYNVTLSRPAVMWMESFRSPSDAILSVSVRQLLENSFQTLRSSTFSRNTCYNTFYTCCWRKFWNFRKEVIKST